jgi:hypothetical protein
VAGEYRQGRSQLEMQRQSENLVRVFEEHISRTIRAVDQSVLFLKYEYESEGNKMDLPHYIKQGIIQSQLFVQIAIIGPDGMLEMSSVPNFKRVDLSDREHFKVHIAKDSGQLFISKPVKGRASKKWSCNSPAASTSRMAALAAWWWYRSIPSTSPASTRTSTWARPAWLPW